MDNLFIYTTFCGVLSFDVVLYKIWSQNPLMPFESGLFSLFSDLVVYRYMLWLRMRYSCVSILWSGIWIVLCIYEVGSFRLKVHKSFPNAAPSKSLNTRLMIHNFYIFFVTILAPPQKVETILSLQKCHWHQALTSSLNFMKWISMWYHAHAVYWKEATREMERRPLVS